MIEDGEAQAVEAAEMTDEEKAEADAAFIEGLLCTPEKIQEQQEALDAASS